MAMKIKFGPASMRGLAGGMDYQAQMNQQQRAAQMDYYKFLATQKAQKEMAKYENELKIGEIKETYAQRVAEDKSKRDYFKSMGMEPGQLYPTNTTGVLKYIDESGNIGLRNDPFYAELDRVYTDIANWPEGPAKQDRIKNVYEMFGKQKEYETRYGAKEAKPPTKVTPTPEVQKPENKPPSGLVVGGATESETIDPVTGEKKETKTTYYDTEAEARKKEKEAAEPSEAAQKMLDEKRKSIKTNQDIARIVDSDANNWMKQNPRPNKNDKRYELDWGASFNQKKYDSDMNDWKIQLQAFKTQRGKFYHYQNKILIDEYRALQGMPISNLDPVGVRRAGEAIARGLNMGYFAKRYGISTGMAKRYYDAARKA